MKRENKKAMGTARIANRKSTITSLEACVAKLRKELGDANAQIVKLSSEVGVLKAAQS